MEFTKEQAKIIEEEETFKNFIESWELKSRFMQENTI